MPMNVNELLQAMIRKGISDIHFKAGVTPILRVNGRLIMTTLEKMSSKQIEELAYSLMSKDQISTFERENELDFSFGIEAVSRFRVNVYRQKSTVAVTLRVLPLKVKTFEDLHLPADPLRKLCGEARGLILVAEITGAGKTTTMNAMLDFINHNFAYNIVTVEDPIEYYHVDAKSSISQREVGPDTKSFKSALKYVLRQDPDVIGIGEMRDFEAMSAGITAAETGHLVISTIHTMDAAQTIDRIVDSYPPHQQHQVRVQLSSLLKGVIAQRLLPIVGGEGRVPAVELLLGTSTMRKLIAEGRTEDMYHAMESGGYYGMNTFDQSLLRLHQEGKITLEEAMANASNPEDLQLKLKGIDRSGASSGT